MGNIKNGSLKKSTIIKILTDNPIMVKEINKATKINNKFTKKYKHHTRYQKIWKYCKKNYKTCKIQQCQSNYRKHWWNK